MRKTLLFPFKLLFFIVLAIPRIIGFLLGAGIRTIRFMAGGLFAVTIGALIGVLVGRGMDGRESHQKQNKRQMP